MKAEVSGSTPTIRTPGRTALRQPAMPAMSPPPADRHEHIVEAGQVRGDLETDRAGAEDDIPIVIGRNEDPPRPGGEVAGDRLGFVAARPPNFDVDVHLLDPLFLDLGHGLGKKELEPDAFEPRRVADGQSMVPRRRRNDPLGPVLAR